MMREACVALPILAGSAVQAELACVSDMTCSYEACLEETVSLSVALDPVGATATVMLKGHNDTMPLFQRVETPRYLSRAYLRSEVGNTSTLVLHAQDGDIIGTYAYGDPQQGLSLTCTCVGETPC